MWRRPLFATFSHLTRRRFSSSSTAAPGADIPVLYSFLQPTIFPLRRQPPPCQTPPSPPPPASPSPPPGKTLETSDKAALESHLQASIQGQHTDEAWRSFKGLASASQPPPGRLGNPLIAHLASLGDLHNLKRAFAAAVFLLERAPGSLDTETLGALFRAMDGADAAAPAFALVRAMFKNRFFAPFDVWGHILIRLAGRSGSFDKFICIFEENCRIALEERIDSMKPDLGACNAVLDGCCRDLGSVVDAEKVLEIMSALGLIQDVRSFGSLAYLYASKGLQNRIIELEKLMSGLGMLDKSVLYGCLVGGYVKSRNFESILSVILHALREEQEGNAGCGSVFGGESYIEVAKCFVENGKIKELAGLVIESQQLESSRASIEVDTTVGYRIVNACVNMGMLDKAHSILDEMNARGASVGLGVYSSILKAYCKERRTAEAALLVTEISAAGLRLDPSSYDALIDASMSAQDFQSAFSLFRDMREARLPDLKVSYLTIMTGLMENHRPELMAGFLDTVVDDPRVQVATHDWNSIIHAFCKVGRLEDARRTYRRMVFLQFEPNEQTYLSLINGYVSAEKYFSVLILWTEVRRKGIKLEHALVDAFLYALVKGGFFDAAMQVVEKAQELKIFVNKWRHKQAFMETHKKLKVAKLRRRNFRKIESLIAFKNWAGLNG